MEEVWKTIPGHSWHQVSSLGRVKRLAHRIPHNNRPGHTKLLRERILKGSFGNQCGFYVEIPNDDGKNHHLIVARAMLTVFVRPPEEGEVARHLDDNKRNQNLSNLAWGTVRDNINDAISNGKLVRGTSHPNSKLTEEGVSEIKRKYKFKDRRFGCYGLAKEYNINYTVVWSIIKGDIWTHVPPFGDLRNR